MIYIILIFIILISVVINVFTLKKINKQKGIINRQNEMIDRASQNIKHLIDYQDIIQNIKKNHSEVYNKIKEAKTDEEVNNIIHNLVNINNKHVHDG